MSLFGFKGRDWTQEETPEGPRIVIPAPRLWPVAAFLLVWLSGWAAGEVSAIKQLWELFDSGAGGWTSFPAVFLRVWLLAWTAGGILAMGLFFFSLDGREVLSVKDDKFCVKLETLFGLGATWRFDITGMTPPRLASRLEASAADRGDPNPLSRLKLGYIAIASGGKKWKLGVGLEEQRAKDLLYALNSRFGLPRERRG